MDTLLNGLGSNPGHKNGDRFKESYQGAGHHKPEERKPEESLAPINVESKVGCSIPPQDDRVFFPFFLQSLAIMMYLYMCLFSLGL